MSERREASLSRRRMISLRVIYTDDTYFEKSVKTFFKYLKMSGGISRQQVHRIEALTINCHGSQLRNSCINCLTFVRSCTERAARAKETNRLFNQFCAGK